MKAAGAATLGAVAASRETHALPINADARARELLVYVGTYTSGGKSEGIYLYRLTCPTARSNARA